MRFDQRLPRSFYEATQRRVLARLADQDLGGALFDHPDDVAYLTGFFHHPSERPVAVWLDPTGAVLLVPRLELEHAHDQGAVATLVDYPEYPGTRSALALLADVARPRLGAGRVRVGVDPGTSWERVHRLGCELPRADVVPTEELRSARQLKQPEELALHREAARITDLMLTAGRERVQQSLEGDGPLPTEAELAATVTSVGIQAMHDEHDNVVVVSPLAGGLVYAGANSARPHGLPSGYRLREGDTFMLSLGCAVGGRYVEGERTFVLGEPSAEQRRYYEAVHAAQQTGGRAITAGTTCASANRACLDVIRAAGLGEHLRHRQGHGIGVGMHEPPWLEDGDPTPLAAGMVVSNEPGIYVNGHGGYRISDSMLVGEHGATPLTSYPRALEDVVLT